MEHHKKLTLTRNDDSNRSNERKNEHSMLDENTREENASLTFAHRSIHGIVLCLCVCILFDVSFSLIANNSCWHICL